jgi:hypothetical protein
LARRYPGERTLLAALRNEAPIRWPRSCSTSPPPSRPPMSLIVRGGELIARYLAVRPPPVLIAAS